MPSEVAEVGGDQMHLVPQSSEWADTRPMSPRGGCATCAYVYGHVGCGADVTEALDRRCSGRRSCVVAIPDASFAVVEQPCPQDLKPYLEAAYRCVTGIDQNATLSHA